SLPSWIAGTGAPVRFRVEQAVQMHDEIAHAGIIDGRLRARLPGIISRLVVGEDADDIEPGEIGEMDIVDAVQLAAKDEMQKLSFGRVRFAHSLIFKSGRDSPIRASIEVTDECRHRLAQF